MTAHNPVKSCPLSYPKTLHIYLLQVKINHEKDVLWTARAGAKQYIEYSRVQFGSNVLTAVNELAGHFRIFLTHFQQ